MNDGSVFDEKKRIRDIASERASRLSGEYKKKASEKIAEKVLALPCYKDAESIFLFFSLPSEPDTSAIFKAAFSDGKAVYAPRIENGVMSAVRYLPGDKLRRTKMGVLEAEFAREAKKRVDLCVMPCAAAAMPDKRLGRGGGFYDAFLKDVKTKKICVLYSALLFDDVPTDEFDVSPDMIITEI